MPIKTKKFSNKSAIKKLEREIHDVEKWVQERKKFLIKLAWTVFFITLLIIISNVYLRVSGIWV